MRTAFAYWRDRIAPVFDTARFIRLVDAEKGRVLAQKEEILEQELPQLRVDRLVELRVDTLVCGAVSRQLEVMIAASGIEVIPFVAGETETVIEAFHCRRLGGDSFEMPGCRGRLRHRGQGRRCRYPEGGRALPGGWRKGVEASGEGSVTPAVCAKCSGPEPEDGEWTPRASRETPKKE